MPAVMAAPTGLAVLGAAAAIAIGSMLALRMAFAGMAAMMLMMSVMMVFASGAVVHDHPLFRRLAERGSAMDSYSARNSSSCVRVLRISAAQASRCSRPIFVIS